MAKSSKPAHALTREQFRAHAKPVTVVINGKEMTGAAKEFSTGSLGWNINEKMQVDVGGQLVTVQVGLNLTIVGSKDIPQDAHSAAMTARNSAASPTDDQEAASGRAGVTSAQAAGTPKPDAPAGKAGASAASPTDGEEAASGRARAASGPAAGSSKTPAPPANAGTPAATPGDDEEAASGRADAATGQADF